MQLLYISLTIFFILFSAFFVAAEFAIVKVRMSRIEELIAQGNKKAIQVKKILNNLNEYLSTAQVGITLASLALGWLGEPTFERLLEPIFHRFDLPDQVAKTVSLIVAFSIITYLHVVFGELAPKTFAILKAEPIALLTARPLAFFHKLLYPFVWALNESANVIVRLLGIRDLSEQENVHSEEELKQLLSKSYESGKINQSEFHYVSKIFEFDNRIAKEIMIPRTEMVCLYNNLSFEENLKIITNEKFTRYPVVEGNKDKVLGIINTKELLLDYLKNPEKELTEYLHPAITVFEHAPVNKLLKRLQKERVQIAILIDEYGGTAGIVTLEDILEEIVGEIRDEFDEDEKSMIEQLSEKEYLLDGKVLLDDINVKFGLEIDNHEIDTVGGWIYGQVANVKEGTKVHYENVTFIVNKMENLRVSKILLQVKE